MGNVPAGLSKMKSNFVPGYWHRPAAAIAARRMGLQS